MSCISLRPQMIEILKRLCCNCSNIPWRSCRYLPLLFSDNSLPLLLGNMTWLSCADRISLEEKLLAQLTTSTWESLHHLTTLRLHEGVIAFETPIHKVIHHAGLGRRSAVWRFSNTHPSDGDACFADQGQAWGADPHLQSNAWAAEVLCRPSYPQCCICQWKHLHWESHLWPEPHLHGGRSDLLRCWEGHPWKGGKALQILSA